MASIAMDAMDAMPGKTMGPSGNPARREGSKLVALLVP